MYALRRYGVDSWNLRAEPSPDAKVAGASLRGKGTARFPAILGLTGTRIETKLVMSWSASDFFRDHSALCLGSLLAKLAEQMRKGGQLLLAALVALPHPLLSDFACTVL